MIQTYGLLLLGFVVLIKGADILIDGASALAKRLRIPELIIGLTIVAFGTSLPELVVNLFANSEGSTDLAIGNILGSNIANILLILGISAMIHPLVVHRVTVWREILFSFLAILILSILIADKWLNGSTNALLSRSDGVILISYFVMFLYYSFGSTRVHQTHLEKKQAKEEKEAALSLPNAFLLIALGITGLLFGGRWIVDSAISIALDLGLSESLVGLTIIAIGTSLPELAASTRAVYRHNIELAVGNAVGSNLFNILWVLGLNATMNPLPFSDNLLYDVSIAVGASLLLFLAMFVGGKRMLTRWQGFLFVLLYCAYIANIVRIG